MYLTKANAEGKNIMFEAQLGAMRDIDFGIHPYTSSSSTIASYAPIGAGVPQLQLDNSIGITGIAPNVEIITIKAECDEKGDFKRTSDLVFGLYYAIERDVDIINMSNEAQTIEPAERICQMVIAKHEQPQLIEVEVLGETERGAGGFGHSGVK